MILTRGWIKLRNAKVHDFLSSPDMIWAIIRV